MTDTNAGPVLPELPKLPKPTAWAGEYPDGSERWKFGTDNMHEFASTYGFQCWSACAEQVAGPLREQLAECFSLGGSDADGNGTEWRAANAVRSVSQLRQDYDEACNEAEKLRERVAELESLTQKAGMQLMKVQAYCNAVIRESDTQLDRLRAENRSLADCLRECADDLESEINARAGGELPRRIERDLEPVRRSRELLAARAERGQG